MSWFTNIFKLYPNQDPGLDYINKQHILSENCNSELVRFYSDQHTQHKFINLSDDEFPPLPEQFSWSVVSTSSDRVSVQLSTDKHHVDGTLIHINKILQESNPSHYQNSLWRKIYSAAHAIAYKYFAQAINAQVEGDY